MKNSKRTSLIKIICIIVLFCFFIAGCATKKNKNDFNLPISVISNVLKVDDSSFVKAEELVRYIIFKNYNFYVLEFKKQNTTNQFITAVSKDNNMFFFLNYPETFSFKNFNTMIKNEKYRIPSEPQALLFIKFLSKLFIPNSMSMEEINDAVERGILPNEPKILQLPDSFNSTITFDMNGYINVDFYSISKDFLIYNWQVRMRNDGVITACRIVMLLLNSDYEIEEEVVIFDKVIEKESNK